jgi:hypothetical protein
MIPIKSAVLAPALFAACTPAMPQTFDPNKPFTVEPANPFADLVPKPTPQPSNVIWAIVKVMGASEEGMAFMNHCNEVDPANKDLYTGLALHLRTLYTPFLQQIDKIFPVEGVRAGRGKSAYYPMLLTMREFAQTEVKGLAATLEPARDIASCQAQRRAFQQGVGLFAPLKSRFPAEMKVIDEWR